MTRILDAARFSKGSKCGGARVKVGQEADVALQYRMQKNGIERVARIERIECRKLSKHANDGFARQSHLILDLGLGRDVPHLQR